MQTDNSPLRKPKIDQHALDYLVEEAEKSHTDALVVVKDGALVGEWYFGQSPGLIETMSMTKSVVSMAIGRLITQRLITSIDEPVWTFFPEWRQGEKQLITIKHLLNHTSGLQTEPTTEEIYRSPNFVKLALAAELTSSPGQQFLYNNKAVNILPAIVEKVAGKKIDAFLAATVFAALEIKKFSWSRDEAKNPHGMAGLQMGAQDFAKLGELMLKKGNWKGERLINEDYVEEAIRPGQEFDSSSGLLWWIDRSQHVEFSWIDRSWQHPEFAAETTSASEFDFRPTTEGVPTTYGFSARGYLGQYLLVLPEERLIAVRQIRSDRHKDESDSFPEFYELVRALIN